MGWKAACLITGDCTDGYLGELPAHHPERVDELLAKLGFVGYVSRKETTFFTILVHIIECSRKKEKVFLGWVEEKKRRHTRT